MSEIRDALREAETFVEYYPIESTVKAVRVLARHAEALSALAGWVDQERETVDLVVEERLLRRVADEINRLRFEETPA